MPERMPKGDRPLPARGALFKVGDAPPQAQSVLNRWALPFPGSDRSVIIRSLYYKWKQCGQEPVQVQTYFLAPSLLRAVMIALW